MPGTAFDLRASGFWKGAAMAPHAPSEIALNLGLALITTSTAPLLLLDGDLTVIAGSKSFCKAFQIDPVTVPGSRLKNIGGGEWDVPQLSSLLNATASGYAEIEGYEIDLLREGQPARRLVLNAQKLEYAGESDIRLVLSVADVTDARAAEKLKEELLREKDILLQELHHRVANSLQIIASVLMQSARKVQSEESRIHLVDAHQRLMSVATLQKQLAASRLGDVELRPYFSTLCESIGASMIHDREKVSLHVTADDRITTADTSICLGLIVTELVINALKHAFPNNREGRIQVDYRTRGADWTLSVGDDGVGFSGSPDDAKPGLGTSIVQALAKQLDAKVSVTSNKPGTKVSMVHTYAPALVAQSAPRADRAV
jgi:two-component system, sensor histidine kinase PdtaS